MVLEKLEHTCKNTKLDPFFTPHTRTNSKWNKDLNVRLKTIKILEENIVKSRTFLRAIFFLIYPFEQGKQEKKWDYIKQKKFCKAVSYQQNEKITS